MYGNLGAAFVESFKWGIMIICITIPLSIWKIIDIIIWIIKHFDITFS